MYGYFHVKILKKKERGGRYYYRAEVIKGDVKATIVSVRLNEISQGWNVGDEVRFFGYVEITKKGMMIVPVSKRKAIEEFRKEYREYKGIIINSSARFLKLFFQKNKDRFLFLAKVIGEEEEAKKLIEEFSQN